MVMIQIQLLPEVEARLAAEAEARGMALESYLRAFVEEKILEDRAIHTQRRQAVEAMFAFSGRRAAMLRGENIKSMIHEGHKY
jgi:hypothetical protein